jgi:hypothetical protein
MHIKIPKFLSAEECKLIEKTLLEKEQEILALPINKDTYLTGTTARYSKYNFLNYIPEINMVEKFFNLPIMQGEDEYWIQCWGNVLNKGEELPMHNHGYAENIFYACNIFISGPDNCFTFYDDTGHVLNKVGELHLVDCHLPHGVKKNTNDQPRLSIGCDIHFNNPNDFNNYKQKFVYAKRN